MINLKKELIIDESSLSKNNYINVDLGTTYNTEKESQKNTGLILAKNNDTFLINLNIKNTIDKSIDSLKFIINDNIFKFIPSSLKNKNTKERYFSLDSNKNIFLLQIPPNKSIYLEFYMKASLDNLDLNSLNTPIIPLTFNLDSNINNVPTKLIKIQQSALKVTSKPNQDKIEIENIGTSPSTNVIYNYEIPDGFDIDIKSIKYDLKNIRSNIKAEKLNNNIIFKIDNIPENTQSADKKITIFLKHMKIIPKSFTATMTIK